MLCAALIAAPARATEPTPISWRDDYGGALEEAKATNRLVWIQFTGPWCPNCLRMERDSFPDADVIDHTQRSFVPLKLRSDVHEQLALGFNLSGLPATVLVAPTREIVAIRQGYLGPDELDQLLSESLAAWRDRDAASKTAAAGTKEGDAKKPEPVRPKQEPQIALSGYCPVSLIAGRRLVRGQTEHTVEHDGRIYRFASADLSRDFRKEPERYIPVNGGNCPVTEMDDGGAKPGNPRWGVLYQGRCSSAPATRPGVVSWAIPSATRWSTWPSRDSARIAWARPGSSSAGIHNTRSRARGAATGSPTRAIARPSWRPTPRRWQSIIRRRPRPPVLPPAR